MSDRGLTRLLSPHRPVLALTLLAAVLYLPSVWLRDAWNPDEPRYAEVAREMVSRGDYILPHLNGEVYAEKPPLFFWLGILAGELPGVPSGSGPRLVSALAAWGTLLLTFLLGRRYAGAAAGWLACLVLATSSMFVIHSSSGVIDATLTLIVTAAIAAGLRAREERSSVLWAMFYLLIGLALITKGPVGFAIPAGALLLWALQHDGVRGMWAWHPAWGIPLALTVAALWIVPAIARGGAQYAEIILFKQNLGRAWQSWHHKEPLNYFLGVFPASFVPWVVMLPGALYGAWKGRRAHPGARLALTWFIFTFIFFSLISGKKTRYLLPLFPAASLLVSLELRDIVTGVAGRLRAVLPFALLAPALVLAGLFMTSLGLGAGVAILPVAPDLALDQKEGLLKLLKPPGSLAVILPGLAIVVLAAGALFVLRKSRGRCLAWLAAAWLALLGWAAWIGVPAFNIVKSARPLARAVIEQVGPEGAVVLYRERFAGAFNLHLRRDHIPVVSGMERIEEFLAAHPGGAVIAGWRDTQRLQARLPDLLAFDCRRIGDDAVCASRAGSASR
jgi:hypothetical protein